MKRYSAEQAIQEYFNTTTTGNGFTTTYLANILGYPVPSINRAFNNLRKQGLFQRNPIEPKLIIPVTAAQ